MSNYIISQEAQRELENIFLNTLEEWGEAQADMYLDDLYRIINMLGDNPNLGRLRHEIREGYRSFPQGSHIIFFAEHNTKIAILRVLHSSRDTEKIFQNYAPTF